MIAAALFDIDGTLIDSNELHVTAWQEVFAAAGHTVARAAIARQIGKGGDKLVPALLPQVSKEEQKALSDAHGRRFKSRYLAAAQPFPHARELLARVHAADIRVVLASSASKEELEYYTKLLHAEALVHAGTSIDDVEESKPAPDIFAIALRKAGSAAERTLAIGDTPYDAEAARKVGVASIGLRAGGWDDAALREAGAIAVYDDVAALLYGFESSPLAQR